MTPPYVRLTDVLGARVTAADGSRLGRLHDVAVTLDDDYPAVSAFVLRAGRRAPETAIAASALTRLEPGTAALAADARPGPAPGEDTLRLGRDVLDVQIVDARARRVARVGEVDLAWDEDVLRLVAVDVGWRAILRRLGLRHLAERTSRDALDWAGLHVAAPTGHALQLSSAGAAVHRLDPADLAELLARLPSDRGAQVLDTLEGARAAAALAAVHPGLAADLVEVLGEDRGAALVAEMGEADAASALRDADPDRREVLLGRLPADRADRLRAALAAPAAAPGAGPRPRGRWWPVLRGHEGWRR